MNPLLQTPPRPHPLPEASTAYSPVDLKKAHNSYVEKAEAFMTQQNDLIQDAMRNVREREDHILILSTQLQEANRKYAADLKKNSSLTSDMESLNTHITTAYINIAELINSLNAENAKHILQLKDSVNRLDEKKRETRWSLFFNVLICLVSGACSGSSLDSDNKNAVIASIILIALLGVLSVAKLFYVAWYNK